MAELMRMSQGSHLTRHSSIKQHPAPGRLQSVCCQACLPKPWPDHCEGPALLAATTAPLESWLVQSQSEAASRGGPSWSGWPLRSAQTVQTAPWQDLHPACNSEPLVCSLAADLEHTFTSAHLQNASSRQSFGSTNGMHTIPEAFGSGGAGSSSASQSWR